jgi:hypothetical protein
MTTFISFYHYWSVLLLTALISFHQSVFVLTLGQRSWELQLFPENLFNRNESVVVVLCLFAHEKHKWV